MTIYEKIQTALKGITVSDLGNGVLLAEQSNKFIEVMQDKSPLLAAARKLDMKSHTRNIDRIAYASGALRKATEGVAIANEGTQVFQTNQLIAVELGAVESITDTTMEDNIEKAKFEATIIRLFGNVAGFDLENIFLNGDKDSVDPSVNAIDGWVKKAGNVIDALAYDETKVEDMFEKMINAYPAKYDEREKLVLFVSRKQENDYRNVLRARGTSLGDTAQTEAVKLAYKGIKLVVVANMKADQALLVNPENLVYGLYRDIRIEAERNAKARATEFTLSMRADCHFENEDAAVVAKGYVGA